MEKVIRNKKVRILSTRKKINNHVTNLSEGVINKEYIVKDIKTDDEDIKKFLFTLGCYDGESVTLISVLSENYVIIVKDATYSINKDLAESIVI